MLANISYNKPEIEEKINELVGTSYSLWDRIKMRGTGSSKFTIQQCSSDICELISRDNNLNVCSIEIRPKGIIIRFRSKLETYGVIIPFHQLTLYKTNESYSIYGGQHKLILESSVPSQMDFFRKVQDRKVEFLQKNRYSIDL